MIYKIQPVQWKIGVNLGEIPGYIKRARHIVYLQHQSPQLFKRRHIFLFITRQRCGMPDHLCTLELRAIDCPPHPNHHEEKVAGGGNLGEVGEL